MGGFQRWGRKVDRSAVVGTVVAVALRTVARSLASAEVQIVGTEDEGPLLALVPLDKVALAVVLGEIQSSRQYTRCSIFRCTPLMRHRKRT